MKVLDIILVVAAIALMALGAQLSNGWVDIGLFGNQASMYMALALYLVDSAIFAVSGILIGWLASNRPLLLGVCAGFSYGILNYLLMMNQLASRNDELVGLGARASLPEAVVTGIAVSLSVCAFSALGVLIKQRRKR